MKNHTAGQWQQTVAAIIMCQAPLLMGISVAWISRVAWNLQKADNELGIEPLNADQASWLVTVAGLGMLSTMLWASKLCERIGRRRAAMVEAFMFAIAWTLKLFATNYHMLLVAQLIQGAADGLTALIVPIYITEIASDAIRGRLVCLFTFSVKSGYLIAFILAATLPYKLMTGFTLIAPVVQLCGLFFMPDAPGYLIKTNRLADAKKSLMYLRGNDETVAESDLLKLQQFYRKLNQAKSSIGLKELFTDRVNLKGFMIAMTMMIIQQMSGIIIMLLYIVTILAAAKTSLDSYTASIIYAGTHLFGCWMSTLTVDRFGRKPLLIISLTGMSISHCALGIFFTMRNSGYDFSTYNWLPIVALNLYGFTYSIGVGPLTPMVSNEVVNPELASICNSIQLVTVSTTAMLLMKFFPLLTSTLGLHNCFFIFTGTCISAVFIIIFVIPETKGRSIESIREGLQSGHENKNKTVEESLVGV